MKQILIITRIDSTREKDEFRREFFRNREDPVLIDFEEIRLSIHSGFDLYDDEDDEVAENIRSKIDPAAKEVIIVIHSLEYESIKSELLKLKDGADWQIQKYSSTSPNYDEIKTAFQDVMTDSSKVETIDELFSYDTALEAKLELLHSCMIPETIPPEEDLDELLADFSYAFKIFVERVREIRKNLESETARENESNVLTWDNKNYIEALKDLRISLLGS